MSLNEQNNANQDVDLLLIWKGIVQFFDSLGVLFVRFIRFLIRNVFIILGILIIGGATGYFIDSIRPKYYKHEIIVVPNFGSTAYLYEKVESQKENLDSVITSIELEPIVDVYGLLSSNGANLEIGEFLSENNINISEHEPGNQTEQIYKYHKLTLETDRKDVDGKIVSNYLENLNNEPYFLERQQIERAHTVKEIEESNISIQNINALFEKFASSESIDKSNLKIEMYPEINGLIGSKNGLISNIKERKISQVEMSKVIYDVVKLENIEIKKVPYLILFPIILFSIYIIMVFFKKKLLE